MNQRPEFTRIRAQLGKSLHFRDLRPTDLDALAELGRIRRLNDNELASAAGRPQEELWVVLAGGLRLSTVTESGDEFVYAILGQGSFYGLGHVIGTRTTNADARAFGPTELAVMEGEPFLALLDRHPRLWRHAAGLLVRRLSLAMSVVRDVSVAPLDQRIARRLLGQAMGGGADINGSAPLELRVNQSDLGRMLGASRSRVNAELRRMAGEGLLKIGYRTLTLVDLARLHEIAGPEVFAF
ncbi:MAG TPA: Crp/Fnr family transcriptional regulator [Burkholderiales bacterium]|jgi:CRP-like cAMP-binding protein|nr:Crp/Fnr family transcriptional regulator [Burkholderiales bacterium]